MGLHRSTGTENQRAQAFLLSRGTRASASICPANPGLGARSHHFDAQKEGERIAIELLAQRRDPERNALEETALIETVKLEEKKQTALNAAREKVKVCF